MSGKSTFKLQHTMVSGILLPISSPPIRFPLIPQHFLTPLPTQDNPTPKELLDHVRAQMENTEPSEPNPMHKKAPAPATKLPNNGYPEGTCAGCGAEDGEDGGALWQCARCKGRKYCGRACQKLVWPKHRPDYVEG